MNAALLIIGLTMAGALALGLRAGRGCEMTLEQWSVGGRGFGTIFVFLLLAGEIYTTFTFLGASGYAYGRGAPTYYILGYGCLAYILSYWLLPLIWRYAKDNRLISQSDFFSRKYDSPTLGVVVSLVGLVALVPYLVLQLKGLGIIVATAGYGAVSSTTAIWVRAAVVTAYVMASGVRGSAWTAVVKDVMILAIVVFLGLYLPIHYYGGLTDMFQAIDAAKPGFSRCRPRARARGGSPPPCSSPRSASSCGRTPSHRSSPHARRKSSGEMQLCCRSTSSSCSSSSSSDSRRSCRFRGCKGRRSTSRWSGFL